MPLSESAPRPSEKTEIIISSRAFFNLPQGAAGTGGAAAKRKLMQNCVCLLYKPFAFQGK
ncbi:MAG: hypothetical protein D8H97_30500 [Neisseria sp.]|nr:MAG: hypothetical protein D8H97_30500 [Neisseria sp.]